VAILKGVFFLVLFFEEVAQKGSVWSPRALVWDIHGGLYFCFQLEDNLLFVGPWTSGFVFFFSFWGLCFLSGL